MKRIALTIGGNQIGLPGQIDTLNNQAGKFGVNIVRLGMELLIMAAALVSLFFLLYGGLRWIMSDGDKKKVEDARNTIVYAIVGLVLVAMSFLIINVLGTFFKVPILTIGP